MTWRIRKTTPDDVPAIMTTLEKLSDEIPINMDKKDSRNALGKIVARCCKQSSWIALDNTGYVIGFLLGEKFSDRLVAGYEVDDGIKLAYGRVLKSHRKQGLFTRLLEEAKALKKPLQADVSHENKSGMADQLDRAGFLKRPCSVSLKEDYFIWWPK
jgi:hypothetical protein